MGSCTLKNWQRGGDELDSKGILPQKQSRVGITQPIYCHDTGVVSHPGEIYFVSAKTMGKAT